MGTPAIVMSDIVTWTCAVHQPSPVPIAGPILANTVPTVLIGGRPAAVLGSMVTMGPHIATITTGSPTVMIGGKPAATQTSMVVACTPPGVIAPTVANVLVG